MEENHMGWKLVKGVRKDLVNLFLRFANTNSVRYEDFCEVWKQMKFSLIYSNRITFVELLEFTEELFQIVKEYLLSVYEFHTRVAALYALYGLYFKQPIRETAKIRFTKSEWEEVQSLIAKCKDEKHYDVVFIHLKMYLSGAYTFTATVRAMGLERGFRKYSEKRSIYYPSNCDVELLYRPLISKKLINSLIQLESLYCRKKAAWLGKRNIEFIDGKFATSLQQELEHYACKNQKLIPVAEVEGSNRDLIESENKEIEGTTSTKPKDKKNKCNKNKDKRKDDQEGEEQEKQAKRNKFTSKYLELIARKKAEFYIKKLQEEYNQQEKPFSQESTFNLPKLDFS